MHKEIVLATGNKHKVEEYRKMLAPLGYVIYSTKDLNIDVDPEETGNTYKENAYIKAKSLRKLVKWPVIADDSGIEIEALDNFPGIHSSRFAESFGNDYKKTAEAVLEKLKDKTNRKASFHCCICLLEEENSKPLYFEGICPGEILEEIKGTNGFGYDPIFHSYENNLDFGTCSSEEKNEVSHRKKAIVKLATYLSI